MSSETSEMSIEKVISFLFGLSNQNQISMSKDDLAFMTKGIFIQNRTVILYRFSFSFRFRFLFLSVSGCTVSTYER